MKPAQGSIGILYVPALVQLPFGDEIAFFQYLRAQEHLVVIIDLYVVGRESVELAETFFREGSGVGIQQVVDLPDGVLPVGGRRVFLEPLERSNLHGQVNLVGVQDGIGLEGDEIFVEPVVSSVLQVLGDALAFGIQLVDVEAHAFLQVDTDGVVAEQGVDPCIVNVVSDVVNHVGLARGNLVADFHAVAFWGFPYGDGCSHITDVLYGFLYLLTGFLSQFPVVNDRGISQSSPQAVDPPGRVLSGGTVNVHRYLYQTEPLGVRVLAHVGRHVGRLDFFVVGFYLDIVQQITVLRDKFID